MKRKPLSPAGVLTYITTIPLAGSVCCSLFADFSLHLSEQLDHSSPPNVSAQRLEAPSAKAVKLSCFSWTEVEPHLTNIDGPPKRKRYLSARRAVVSGREWKSPGW